MAGANSNIQITDLDFNNIKSNLKKYLQGQDTLKDYNYEGSALSTLLDILAYNTQYNAYYLNMVSNEMFLDSALKRSSVVSHAKLLDYVPKSSIAPSAIINLKVNQVKVPSLTLPAYTKFLSEAIDGVNYNFVTTDSTTVTVDNTGTALFQNIQIKQGLSASMRFTVDSATNPKYLFTIPETNVDTTSLKVSVQQSSSSSATDNYTLASGYLTLNSNSLVYFLQESLNGQYEIYFGDGVLGKKLPDGAIVNVSYVVTNGTSSAGANNFVLMQPISGYSNNTIYPVFAASQGGNKESIDSIKFQAPKSYAAQGRAVTKEDYITVVQQNQLGYSFDAVNVWGGQENNPPVYGQVFICLKPAGSYLFTQTQKQRLLQEVIKPISVMTVEPNIVDPDYTYLKLNVNVLYDPKKTAYTAAQIQSIISTAITNFGQSTLNTFNSTFSVPELTLTIQNSDPSIITNEISVQVQKKFYPILGASETYTLNYGVGLNKGMFLSGVNSFPSIQYVDPSNPTNTIDGVYIEEVPSAVGGVESISVTNPGFGYLYAPIITILGDGTGATAIASINSTGTISQIVITSVGSNYTNAVVQITPDPRDTNPGQLGAAIATVISQYGTLRLYYYNKNNIKTIINSNIGTIDYLNGIVTIKDFNPLQVSSESALGQLSITANPSTTIISSYFNRIITIDPYDTTAITVNVTAKNS